MNRLSSLITAGLTTGLSAAALGATAMAQGVFGGGETAREDTAAVQQVAEATTDATAAVAAATESPTPRIVYVDKEPIVVTRQVQVAGTGAPASQEGAGGAAAGGTSSPAAETPSPSATSPSMPSPSAAPPQVRSAAPEPAPSWAPPAVQSGGPAGSNDVSTAGAVDDNGGTTPRDNRVEVGDDRDGSREDDDRDDDDNRDDRDREDDDDDD